MPSGCSRQVDCRSARPASRGMVPACSRHTTSTTGDWIMHKLRRALVIGAAGNIGTPLVDHLRSIGYDVLEVDIRPGWRPDYLMADITHPLDLLRAFDWQPDVVFMLAASVGRMTCEQ